MRRFERPVVWAAIVVLVVVGVAGGDRTVAQDSAGEDSLYKHLSVFSEVLSLVRRAYVEETDLEVLFGASLSGVPDALDPFATYVPASGVESSERAREIGIRHSGVRIVKERGIAYVLAVDPGSPGEEAGLRMGDIVAAIDGVSTRRAPLWRIRAELAAAPGTRIDLEVVRLGRTLEKSLRLAVYESRSITLEHREGIPIVQIGRFEAGVADQLSTLLADLAAAGETHLIVDLRGTAAGEPASAYAVAGFFVQGELGRLMKRREIVESFVDTSPPIWSGRLLVLTDRGTQGAAEILARILVLSADAEQVGQRTFGHAGRESVKELSNGARLVLTDAFYTGPDSEILDESLQPHIPVTDTGRGPGKRDLSADDLILERALEYLRSEQDLSRKVARVGR